MAAINDLISQIKDPDLQERIQKEVDKLTKQKKFGLVFEEHLPEYTPLYDMPVKTGCNIILKNNKEDKSVYTVLDIKDDIATCCKRDLTDEQVMFPVMDIVRVAEFGEPIYPYLKLIDSVCNAPDSDLWHTLIEADNYHALQLLEYLYAGKVDCIYIDPPYNTGARDWKYNNDYVDSNDSYRHSKWLSMMEKRLKIAKKLMNPNDSVLIVTIDEKEYLHLGCLLEQMFSESRIQMITNVISAKGVVRVGQFSRIEEYIYIVEMGSSALFPQHINMFDNIVKKMSGREIEWLGFRRRAPQAKRGSSPNQFYPIFVNKKTGLIQAIGDPLKNDVDRNTVIIPNDCIALWPLSQSGDERIWSLIPSSAIDNWHKGYLKVKWNQKNQTGTVYYLASGTISDIESGKAIVNGYDIDGSVMASYQDVGIVPPKKVWNMKSHNAETYGTSIISEILADRNFSYPKSVYAVYDTIRFYVADKPDALIVDFFAGSGTTLQAVNLLNAGDGGHRRCIMVTNNEVSDDEAKYLEKHGFQPGDSKWEQYGIARYVTWPRTICSIKGQDINGHSLKGDYGIEEDYYLVDEDSQILSKKTGEPIKKKVYQKVKHQLYPNLAEIKKAEGFKSNCMYFKLGFLDKTSVALGRQFAELLPILWMKAGAIGQCPSVGEDVPDMLILPENKFAVLNEENAFATFEQNLQEYPEIQTVFLVTDYDVNYRSMARSLNVTTTYQLYRDYLDNFRINHTRD